MKALRYALIVMSVGLGATTAFGGTRKACFQKAATAAEKAATRGYYDDGGFETSSCAMAANNKVVICEVGAMKGGGEASDTFRVVLNATCTHSFRVELIGVE